MMQALLSLCLPVAVILGIVAALRIGATMPGESPRFEWPPGWVDVGATDDRAPISEAAWRRAVADLDSAIHTSFEASQLSAASIAHIFGVPAALLGEPVLTDPFASPPTEEQTKQRLERHLCVWCARPLPDDHADDTFCCQEHQEAWHGWKNGIKDPLPDGGRARWEDMPELAERIEHDRLTRERVEQLIFGNAGRAAGRLGGLLPQGASLSPIQDAVARRYARTPEQRWLSEHAMPTAVVPPGPRSRTDQADRLGPAPFGMYALCESEPPPYCQDYPMEQVRRMTVDGWADMTVTGLSRTPGSNLPPSNRLPGWVPPAVRQCPECGDHRMLETAIVVIPDPALSVLDILEPQRPVPGIISETAILCARCHHRYAAPVMVPMARQARLQPGQTAPLPPGTTPGIDHSRLECRVVTTRGHFTQIVTREFMERSSVADIAAMVWTDAFRRCAEVSVPWRCNLPGCDQTATNWIRLQADLAYDGWLWQPMDNAALHIPLCYSHHGRLWSSLYSILDVRRLALHADTGWPRVIH